MMEDLRTGKNSDMYSTEETAKFADLFLVVYRV